MNSSKNIFFIIIFINSFALPFSLTPNRYGSPCVCQLNDSKRACTSFNLPFKVNATCVPKFSVNLKLQKSSNGIVDFLESFSDQEYIFTYRLDLSNNDILELDFHLLASFPHLMSLNLSNNQIISFSTNSSIAFPALKTIYLDNNKLSTIKSTDFSIAKNLESLELSFNTIQKFVGILNITNLNLQHNNLFNISDNFLQNLTLLKYLDLRYNNLSQIGDQIFSNNMNNLKILQISYNNLSFLHYKTFNNLQQLNKLELQFNKLSQLDSRLLHNLINLEYLDISSNNLESIHHELFHSLTKLKYCNISYNRIINFSIFTFQYLPQLESLAINNNKIKSFYIDDILSYSKSFEKLFLNNNNWECNNLLSLIRKCHTRGIIITPGKIYNQSNILGFACKKPEESNDQNNKDTDISNDINNLCNLVIVCIIFLLVVTIFVAVQTFISFLKIYKPRKRFETLELLTASEE